ncbi:hypothetical protein DFH07DRAFT_951375 [Mycena maculata]|uniref:Epoxide hydrolase N-terminal domain-containing protein n=1 Tax=Mycena maculata TaxID=230809 RepID=A0AAD7K1Y4_9AGAR|nr:hypothetical protein DFH07DRAFT_951375 [Mycena maculata]
MDPTILALGQASRATADFEWLARNLIAAAEENIARIESQIRDLIRLRDRERGTIARLRIAIAPIHKLPAELLAEIFLLVANNGYGMTRWETINEVQVLTQVCAYWRQVAHTTPRLWIGAVDNRVEKTPTDNYLACTKGWLERSTPLPVPVYLEGQGNDDIGPLMEILANAVHRWSSAQFILPSLSVLSRIPRDSAKSLHTLRLRSADTQNPARIATFSVAPQLRTLELTIRRPNLLPMPWSQLTDLTVRSTDPLPCLDTLVRCPNLVCAAFETNPWNDVPDLSNLKMTTLSQLHTLKLDFTYRMDASEHFMPFFGRLTLPVLKNLQLELKINTTWTSIPFTEFQLRSPNIEYLSIDNSNLDSGDLLAVLHHAPSLVRLQTDCCMACFDDVIIAGLRYSEGNAVHLTPRLEVLWVSIIENDFDEEGFDAMIQSRWWTDEQLIALPSPPKVARWSSIAVLRVGVNIGEQLEAKIIQYRTQGLDIDGRHHSPDELDGSGWEYGVPLADVKRLVARWHDGYDYKYHEAQLNAALLHEARPPLLFVHGWPGSFKEARKILPLLTEKSANHPSFRVVALDTLGSLSPLYGRP